MEPNIQALEIRRRQLSSRVSRFFALTGVLAVIFLMLSMICSSMLLLIPFVIVLLIALAVYYGAINPEIKQFKLDAKQLLVQNVLAEKFTDLTYSPNGLSPNSE